MTEISRRKFIQLSVVGGAVAAAGCDPKHLTRYNTAIYKAEVTGQYGGYDNRVYPYLNQPDGLQDGVPQYFATVCRMCPAGCGLFVRTMGGRAIKIEGNPAHPVSRGASCARGQAALQHLYNPDRVRFPLLHAKRGDLVTRDRGSGANPPDERPTVTEVAATPTTWEIALKRVSDGLLGVVAQREAERGADLLIKAAGGRVAILADAQEFGSSPTQSRLLQEFAAAAGATVYSYALLDDAPWRAAARAVYGRDQVPAYQLDQADFIVSFGGDFLEAWPSPVLYGRQFGEFRQGPRRAQGEHGKFIYVGPRMSMTAAKADQWLPCNPGTESAVAQAVAGALPLAQAAAVSGLTAEQIQALADGFRRAGPGAVAVAGNGLFSSANVTQAFTAVESLNTQYGSRCVGFGTAAIAPPAPHPGGAGFRQVQALVQAMQAGQVGALLIVGNPNPVFTLPTATGLTAALLKVPFVAALTPFEDETSAYADVVLPMRTFLEEWGDHVPPVIPPGTMATLQQPIIDPQFIGGDGMAHTNDVSPSWMDTRPTFEVLKQIAAGLGKTLATTDTRAAVRKTWAALGQATLSADVTEDDRPWVEALAQGGLWDKAAPAPSPAARPAPAAYAGPTGPPPTGSFALQLYPSIYNHDGRHANLGWMQETPDPMTMAVWNSWVEINADVAHKLDIFTGDVVRLTSAQGSVETLAVPTPGLHPGVVSMPIGQGHQVYGRNASGRGNNPLAILEPTADAATGALAYGATHVTLTKVASAQPGYTPDNKTLVLVQDRPNGQEPAAVMDLIHTTAKEWKTAPRVYGAPRADGSIFNRGAGAKDTPEERGPAG
jgi:anaerobic selenocysteine-containing dehydrogenase